jgi:carbon monoxide dehydrogenase subunit G
VVRHELPPVTTTGQLLIERSVEIDRPGAEVWDGIVDWERHGDWVPLTTMVVSEPSTGVGARFVGRTGIGGARRPIGFDDVFEVVRWQPPDGERPGRCDLRRVGRVIRGEAWFEVHPLGPDRTRVDWGEVAVVPTLLRPLTPLFRAVFGAGLTRVLRRMARDLARHRSGSA